MTNYDAFDEDDEMDLEYEEEFKELKFEHERKGLRDYINQETFESDSYIDEEE